MVTEKLAREHGADLRREAAAFRVVSRAASRLDRCAPSVTARMSAALRRRPAIAGCQA